MYIEGRYHCVREHKSAKLAQVRLNQGGNAPPNVTPAYIKLDQSKIAQNKYLHVYIGRGRRIKDKFSTRQMAQSCIRVCSL